MNHGIPTANENNYLAPFFHAPKCGWHFPLVLSEVFAGGASSQEWGLRLDAKDHNCLRVMVLTCIPAGHGIAPPGGSFHKAADVRYRAQETTLHGISCTTHLCTGTTSDSATGLRFAWNHGLSYWHVTPFSHYYSSSCNISYFQWC